MSLTPSIPRPIERSLKGTPHLLEVLDCESPLRPLARRSLAGADEVVLGRGEAVTREGRTLRVGLPDRWMSVAHARLRREGESWRAEDLGSTNGTFVNGERTPRATLRSGDRLGIGRVELTVDLVN